MNILKWLIKFMLGFIFDLVITFLKKIFLLLNLCFSYILSLLVDILYGIAILSFVVYGLYYYINILTTYEKELNFQIFDDYKQQFSKIWENLFSKLMKCFEVLIK